MEIGKNHREKTERPENSLEMMSSLLRIGLISIYCAARWRADQVFFQQKKKIITVYI